MCNRCAISRPDCREGTHGRRGVSPPPENTLSALAVAAVMRCGHDDSDDVRKAHIMINNADDAMPARCQSCVPGLNCVFFLSDDDECACPERARMIAIDVNDAGSMLRHEQVNLNDRAAIEAVLHPESEWEWIERAMEAGSLDDFIERAVECAKAKLDQ